jgi:CheY-like chemotaxis protein
MVTTHGRVLVVEDDASMCSLVAQALEFEGYAVDVAPNGRTALDLVRRVGPQPDVILLDMGLPVMDGAAFAQAYRDQVEGPASIVVFTSASAMQAAADAERIGASGFVVKPFELDTLLDVLDREAQRAREARQSRPARDAQAPAGPAEAHADLQPLRPPASQPSGRAAQADGRRQSERQHRLRRLAEDVTATRAAIQRVQANIQRWQRIERTRKLDKQEASTVQRLRLESEGLLLEIRRLRQDFESLRGDSGPPK